MESAERRRRIAIAEASDKLWNGEITRHSFEPETGDGGAADSPRDQSHGRPELRDRAIQ